MQELLHTDIDALYQSHKELYCRLDLYEYAPDSKGVFTMRKIDEVSGVFISGSVDEDADSEIRRTADLSLHVRDSTFVVSSSSAIWLDKYVIVYVGYPSQTTKEMLWYNLGLMEILETNYSYDTVSQLLTLSLADPTVSWDGTKGGAVSGGVKLPADSQSIRRALEDTISSLGNWHQYIVDNVGEYGYENVTTKNRIPYTIELKTGCTVYDVIKELRDLYPGYESYFDRDGTFIVRRIPSCLSDPVIMTHDQMKPLVISEPSNRCDFGEVRNVTEIFGTSFDEPDYYTEIVYGDSGRYIGEFKGFSLPAIEDGMYFSFMPNHTSPGSSVLKVNDLPPIPIMINVPNVGDKEVPPGFIQESIPVMLRYCANPDTSVRRFEYLGQTQIRGIYILRSTAPDWQQRAYDMLRYQCHNIKYGVNPDSPLTVEKIGEKKQVFSENEYALLDTEVRVVQRAEYETWKACNLGDTIQLETVMIPWLEVNQKIAYESPFAEMERRELGEQIDHDYDTQYIVKRISTSLKDGTQTLELVRFYDQYPFIISSSKVHV